MNTIDILKAARAEVAKGWCKNALEDRHGNVCALGALCRVDGTLEIGKVLTSAASAAFRALNAHLSAEYDYIVDFNNDDGTTQQDVLNLFEKTICDLGGAL